MMEPRIYLPREDLRRFGVTEEQIYYAQRVDENYINMMKFEIARARMYYERARRGVFMLAESSLWMSMAKFSTRLKKMDTIR
jgi:phytoene synthase